MGLVNKMQLLDGTVEVRSPFKLETDGNRKYIRLELAEPVTFREIKQPGDSFAPQGVDELRQGSILNLSSGGALIDSADVVAGGSLIAMSFKLQGDIELSDVLAIVRRVEIVDGSALMGVAFVGREQLMDVLSGAELELLDSRFKRFEMQAANVLAEFITTEEN